MQMEVVDIDLTYVYPSITVACIYPHRRGHTELCAILVQGGANPSIVDGSGKTPLDYAKTAAIRQILAEAGQQKGR